jgi:hypothetical protein
MITAKQFNYIQLPSSSSSSSEQIRSGPPKITQALFEKIIKEDNDTIDFLHIDGTFHIIHFAENNS